MNKIILRTSGLTLPGRKRVPDIDHATVILDHIKRGYIINASEGDTPWSVTILRFPDGSFSNQPEGTTEVLRFVVNYWSEDAALTDHEPPTWVPRLDALLCAVVPFGWHISRNMTTTTKETPT